MTSEDLETRKKRLIYHSWYRGCKETDILLGRFAKATLANFTPSQLDLYESLLDENDWDIFAWLTKKSPLPPEHQNEVTDMLQAFHQKNAGK